MEKQKRKTWDRVCGSNNDKFESNNLKMRIYMLSLLEQDASLWFHWVLDYN